jgi:hypothetical protein
MNIIGASLPASFFRCAARLFRSFRRERGDDFLEARIAAQWVPPGQEFQSAVTEIAGQLCRLRQMFQGTESLLMVAEVVPMFLGRPVKSAKNVA